MNANEPTAGPGFPVKLGRDTFGDWRAHRIRRLLADSERETPQSFALMQTDIISDYAQRLLPVLNALAVPKDDPGAPAAALLQGWDGRMAMADPRPLIFNAWTHAFMEAVLAANSVDPDEAPILDDRFILSLLLPADGAAGSGQGLVQGRLPAAAALGAGQVRGNAPSLSRFRCGLIGAGVRRIRRSSPIHCSAACP